MFKMLMFADDRQLATRAECLARPAALGRTSIMTTPTADLQRRRRVASAVPEAAATRSGI